MRSRLLIALFGFLLLSAGCKNFKWGGNWANTNNNSGPVEGVNVYNCTDNYQIEVFKRPVGNGNAWTYVNAMGSSSNESDCPGSGDVPVYVDVSDGDTQVRLNYYDVNDNCEGNDPEGDCFSVDKSFEGAANGKIDEWRWSRN